MELGQKFVKPGPLFTKKTPSYWSRNFHCIPEAVVTPSEIYEGDSNTTKIALFW